MITGLEDMPPIVLHDLVEQLDCGEGEDPLSALAQGEEPPPAVDGNLAAESFWEVLQKAESRRQPSRDEDIERIKN